MDKSPFDLAVLYHTYVVYVEYVSDPNYFGAYCSAIIASLLQHIAHSHYNYNEIGYMQGCLWSPRCGFVAPGAPHGVSARSINR